MDEKQSALIEARGVWNEIAASFNPAIVRVAAVPGLEPVADIMRAIAAPAIAGADIVRDAITAAGVDLSPPLSTAESAASAQLRDQISALLQSFEDSSGLQVMALALERAADGKIAVADFTLIR